jgi:hypothetical protein
MKRVVPVLLSLSVSILCVSQALGVDHGARRAKAPTVRPQVNARQPSIELPRLQLGPDGRILSDEWNREVSRRAAAQKAAAKKGTSTPPRNTVRDGGRYTKDAYKRGAGKWPKVNPPSTAKNGGTNKGVSKTAPRNLAKGTPRAGGGGKMLKAAGGIGAAVGGGVVAGNLIANSKQLDADLRAGRITQAQYNRAQATNAVNAAGTVIAIKKMTPTAIAGNALIGTDPISFGVDAVGDLINGTDNAGRSLANVGRTLEGHAKGVEKLVTNPDAWAKEAGRNIEKEVNKVGRDLDKAGKDIGKAVNQAGKDVDKFFKGMFGG